MPDSTSTPEYTVTNACISFSEAIIQYRPSLMSVDEANETGQDLFTWFQENGGTTADTAPFAVRATALGTLAIQKSHSQSADDVVQMIKDTYEHYSGTDSSS
jgi:hypothetical protein